MKRVKRRRGRNEYEADEARPSEWQDKKIKRREMEWGKGMV